MRDIAEAELESAAPLSVFGPFQVLVLVRFTGIGWALQERIEALARGGTR